MPLFIPDQMLLELADCSGSIRGVALAALAGDDAAEFTLLDWLEEQDMLVNPFEEGQCYFICTVTLYYVGRVVQSSFGWVTLEDASWVHWTGRLSVLLGQQKFTGSHFGARKPRTEYCGRVTLATSAVVSAYPWRGELPRSPVE